LDKRSASDAHRASTHSHSCRKENISLLSGFKKGGARMIEQSISYCQKRLSELGITTQSNTLTFVYKGVEKEGLVFSSDENDNIDILYLDPKGNQVTFFNGRATKPYTRKRWKVPQRNSKYYTPKGAESYPFLSPQILEKVRLGLSIETLFITEGEFKAFAGCMHGLNCIGIAGIHQSVSAYSKSLHPYILQVIEVCQVKNLVLLFDSDALQITSDDKILTPETMREKDLRKRSLLFASAVKTYKEACKELNVDVYFGYIRPENNAKGLDDLLVAMPNDREEIIKDALQLSKANSYFQIISLKENSHNKLNELFGVDSVESFYQLHAELLASNDFKYGNTIYCFDKETGTVIESANNYLKFWVEHESEESGQATISLDLENLLQLLNINGFRLYQLAVTEYILVKVKDNIVCQVSSKNVKEFVRDYVHFQKALSDSLKHTILNAINVYTGLFSMEKLNALKCIESNFHTDSDKVMYFYFQNGFVEVDVDGISLRPYSDLSGYIWKAQILLRDYKSPSDPNEVQSFMFAQFVEKICSIRKEEEWVLDESRLDAFTSLLGYALHTFKKERRALAFTDTEISDNPEGRTGKTIIGKALGKLRVYSEIDGKGYDPTDRFRYQDANLDTQILHLNDVGRDKKPFDFEMMFTAVTEGVRVEKKGQATFTIRPTIIISSNRALDINGGSAKARIIEFEFANYFSDQHSPKDEFGAWFFDDWTEKQWNLFDYYMLSCALQYLADGVIIPVQVKLDERKLIQATGNHTDFQKFAEALIKPETSYVKKELLEIFKGEYPEYEKITAQTFTKWLNAYGLYKGWKVTEGTKDKKGNRTLVYKINGKV
ncbi:MAG: hypothetical protein V4714_21335, partial [Bacteroidota bacterium]